MSKTSPELDNARHWLNESEDRTGGAAPPITKDCLDRARTYALVSIAESLEKIARRRP